MMPMTAKQFEAVRELVYKSLGLYFEDAKIDFMDKRVEKRMSALGMGKVDDYVFHLRFLDKAGLEMQALANLVTTNETYMFREFEQLQAFADYCLPEAIERREVRRRFDRRGVSAGTARPMSSARNFPV